MKFLNVPGLNFDDLYQLGGHLRHRRLAGQFYQMWSGDYDSSRFEKAKQEWYSKQPDPEKTPAPSSRNPEDGYTKQKDSEETDDGFGQGNKSDQPVARYGKIQMLDMPGPKRGIKDGNGPFLKTLNQFVSLSSSKFNP